jgi:hypothetical protein
VVRVVLDSRREESVDEGSLAETRLASNLPKTMSENSRYSTHIAPARAYHDSKGSSSLRNDLVSLVGEIGNANGGCALGGSGRSHCTYSRTESDAHKGFRVTGSLKLFEADRDLQR